MKVNILCSANVTVQVDTEWIQNFLFPAQARLIWPSLLQDGHRLRFQPTQVGNLSVSYLPTYTILTILILILYSSLHICHSMSIVYSLISLQCLSEIGMILSDIFQCFHHIDKVTWHSMCS